MYKFFEGSSFITLTKNSITVSILPKSTSRMQITKLQNKARHKLILAQHSSYLAS